eukprot:CAMPEP_0113555572 /NCGR_PEP_ID=MMETSP0015_2-20120614/16791_1 /TAXON_ID=2838 /ORGANISM="Odontella" /LENGTH=160 /DNA_ID=CAMNT_0000456863 /DNA_START=42 /DNA_END=520 /DNA_ORIENTATION=+ /assembly_acc=CAM_ASM_000160
MTADIATTMAQPQPQPQPRPRRFQRSSMDMLLSNLREESLPPAAAATTTAAAPERVIDGASGFDDADSSPLVVGFPHDCDNSVHDHDPRKQQRRRQRGGQQRSSMDMLLSKLNLEDEAQSTQCGFDASSSTLMTAASSTCGDSILLPPRGIQRATSMNMT